MTSTRSQFFISMASALFALSTGIAFAQTDRDLIEVARSVIKVDRQAVVVSSMELTETESKEFWPLYQEYRFEMDKVANGLMTLVLEYAKVYPNVPEARASQLLKEYISLQEHRVEKRAAYFKKFSSILPATKALRFAQVETRLDLLIDLQMAAEIPLVPVVSAR